jgi:outer membrane receptor protein involved in Fe transport
MRRNITRGHRRSPVYTALIVALMGCPLAWPTWAQTPPPADARASIDIPAGDLAGALDRLSAQTGLAFMYQPDLVAGKQARAFAGQFTWQEALRRLLDGSGLQYRQINATTVVIRPTDGSPQRKSRPAEPASASDIGEKPPVTDIQGFTVTGTRIRGGTTPSPVITIGSETIREEGFADLGEVIRSIPQNFRGGQNPGAMNGGNVVDQNITGGSSLNLRGLGPDATLTLLNGRRLAYGGFSQGVDISAIPVEAVDRIEIVADGASAIYGSDAVGGVGNVIIKRNYEGVAVAARHSTTTDGGLDAQEYRVTAGHTWSTGSMIATARQVETDPIFADQRSFTHNLISPRTIYPGSDLKSGLISAHQSLGAAVELNLDALRTNRVQEQYYGTAAYYNHYRTNTSTTLVSPSVDFWLAGDWTLSLAATWGEDDTVDHVLQIVNPAQPATVLSNICYCNESRSYEVGAEGPLFALGGGDARVAVGAGYRWNEYYYRSTTVFGGSDSSRFAYAELNLPFIGEASGIRGFHRLNATLAVRTEDYETLGRVTTPKLGLMYDPNRDFTFKVSWGKSFKGPTLNQQNTRLYGYLESAASVGGSGYSDDATVLETFGGNPDLKPERAHSWTGGVDYHPEALPDLDVGLNVFDIEYRDRVLRPMISSRALSTPGYADFVKYSPTSEEMDEVLAMPNFYNLVGAPYNPGKVVAILYNQYTNVAEQRVRGIDLNGSYRFAIGPGRLTIRGSSAWLDSSQKNSDGQASYDLAGMIFNPAHVNARLGAVWDLGGFSAATFVNYTGSVKYLIGPDTVRTGSFTTFDTSFRYLTDPGDGFISGLEFALSIQNLLNRKPPPYRPPASSTPPYDSLNYSPIGRLMSLSVSKHW